MIKHTHGFKLLLAVLLLALPLGAAGCEKKDSASSGAGSAKRQEISSVAQSGGQLEVSSAAQSVRQQEIPSAAQSSRRQEASSAAQSKQQQEASSAAQSSKQQEVSSTDRNRGLKKAPDFTLKNRQGKNVSLSDYAGKIVVLNFWASWCGPCRAEMPEFEELHKKYSKTGDVKFLMINQTFGQETKASADAYLNREKFTFEVLYDTGEVGYQTYKVSSYPTTMVVNADGYVTGGKMGTATKAEVEALIKGAR